MTYVHVNPGPDNWGDEASQALTILGLILSDTLGKASVPALSFIGGFLAIKSLENKKNLIPYIKTRFSTLIIPAVTWNVIIITTSYMILFSTGGETFVIRDFNSVENLSALILIDKLTGLTYGSTTMAFNFLRDIFVASALLPILIYILRKYGTISLIVLWTLGINYGFEPIIYRPHILMFFSLGIYLYLEANKAKTTADLFIKTLLVIGISILISLILRYSTNTEANISSTVFRILISTAILTISYKISETRFARNIIKLEPISYLLFLSHQTTMLVLWGGWQTAFGSSIEGYYKIFYLVAPILSLIVAIGLNWTITHLGLKKIQTYLNGK